MKALNKNFLISALGNSEIKWPCRDRLPELNPKYGVCFWHWLSPGFLNKCYLPASQVLTEQDFTSFGQGFSSFSKVPSWGQFLPPKQGQHGNQFPCLWKLISILGPELNDSGRLPPFVTWDLLRHSAGCGPLCNMQPPVTSPWIPVHFKAAIEEQTDIGDEA